MMRCDGEKNLNCAHFLLQAGKIWTKVQTFSLRCRISVRSSPSWCQELCHKCYDMSVRRSHTASDEICPKWVKKRKLQLMSILQTCQSLNRKHPHMFINIKIYNSVFMLNKMLQNDSAHVTYKTDSSRFHYWWSKVPSLTFCSALLAQLKTLFMYIFCNITVITQAVVQSITACFCRV